MGKIFARIIQERLQTIAETILPESQCGFRKGRGCVDMIFVLRQLVEKTCEHDDTLFILFVDLKKAYDSVPRSALWRVLEKVGVPPTMLQIIRSFHDGMKAEIRVGSSSTDSIEVKNGLRQGCTLAPTLFNIYYSVVIANWRERCPSAGVNVKFKYGRKLVGDRTAKSRLKVVRTTESQFADDAATYATSRKTFESSATELKDTVEDWGMVVSIEKTKGMMVGSGMDEVDTMSLQMEHGSIEMMNTFPYLGSIVARDGEITSEIASRIAKASRVFGCLRKPIFQNPNLSVSTKRFVYRAVVLSVLFYAAETWTIKAPSMRRLRAFHNRCIRSILGVSKHQQWRDQITSEQLAASFGMEDSIEDLLMTYRLRWIGHIARMGDERLPKKLLFGEFEKKRPFHGTKKRWRDGVKSDLQAIGIGDNWYDLAQERSLWRKSCIEGIRSQRMRASDFTANRMDRSSGYLCPCGRSFRRKGDLTRHSRFCIHYC